MINILKIGFLGREIFFYLGVSSLTKSNFDNDEITYIDEESSKFSRILKVPKAIGDTLSYFQFCYDFAWRDDGTLPQKIVVKPLLDQ